MLKATELATLAAILALSAKPHKQTPHKSTNVVREVVEDAAKLIRHAARLQRLGEQQCNGVQRGAFSVDRLRWESRTEWTEADQAANDKSVEVSRAVIRAVVADYRTEKRISGDNGDCAIAFQRDPRGSPVKVAFITDTWVA